MSHYFTNNLNNPSNRKEISFRFFDVFYTFTVDNGVFSKDHIDPGSLVLLSESVKYELNHKTICDLGCGYGVIGIVIKKMFPQATVFGFDVNPRAVQLAQLNAQKNQVEVCFEENNKLEQACDVVIFNPPIRAGKEVIYDLFAQIHNQLNIGGYAMMVMRKSHGVQSAIKFCKTMFSQVEIVKRDKGHYVFITKK